jgi:hypothetical protein
MIHSYDARRPTASSVKFAAPESGTIRARSFPVRGTLHESNYIVSLGEEGVPVIQGRLLFVIQILPLWLDILRFCRRLSQCSGSVFPSEDFAFQLANTRHFNRNIWENEEAGLDGIRPVQMSVSK